MRGLPATRRPAPWSAAACRRLHGAGLALPRTKREQAPALQKRLVSGHGFSRAACACPTNDGFNPHVTRRVILSRGLCGEGSRPVLTQEGTVGLYLSNTRRSRRSPSGATAAPLQPEPLPRAHPRWQAVPHAHAPPTMALTPALIECVAQRLRLVKLRGFHAQNAQAALAWLVTCHSSLGFVHPPRRAEAADR